jgi:hypothetical protein
MDSFDNGNNHFDWSATDKKPRGNISVNLWLDHNESFDAGFYPCEKALAKKNIAGLSYRV